MKDNHAVASERERQRFIRIVETATESKFRGGNQFAILQNGDEIFPAMLKAIRKAKHRIDFLTYVFWRSEIATEFADALCERAKAGVTVRLLVDAAGGASIGARTIWQLEHSGVRLEWFRPGYFKHLRMLNHRTHRKILIVDGQTCFTGGVGIADEWTGSASDKHHWRETHCQITGPACVDMHVGFAESWFEATGVELEAPQAHATDGDVSVATTVSTANKSRPTQMEHLLRAIITGSKQRLWITSAYFVPNHSYVLALIDAAKRGVDVRVLTNGNLSNQKLALLAGRASYQQLLDGGVKIYEYQKTVLHAKVLTADSAYATLGSTNLDDRSLVLNDELNISIVDEDLVGELDLKFLKDLKNAIHIRSTHWYLRGWASRIAEAGSNMFRGQL